MGCKNCGQTHSVMNDCGCDEMPNGIVNVCLTDFIIPIETLPSPQKAKRQQLFLLPSNQVFLVNYDHTGWVELDTLSVLVDDSTQTEEEGNSDV